MSGDADNSARADGDVVHLLERALGVAKRRRRYRLALALIGLAVLTTFIVLGIALLASG